MTNFLSIKNGDFCPVTAIPQCEFSEFSAAVKQAVCQDGWRVSALFTLPRSGESNLLIVILLAPQHKALELLSTEVGQSYQSLTSEIPAFHWFEREIFEETGIKPEGHPWLKPIRFSSRTELPGVLDYFQVSGEETHEVAVGPVHAGVIEPGHFRFQCMGEDVFSLEIELGYQHRGVEKLLVQETGPGPRTQPLLETAAGDTSIAASSNYCRIIENMAGITVPPRAQALRRFALELERIANHIGDLGALAGDVAFLPTSSFCGRIRGDFLNMTAMLCGNRFGRNYVIPGGVSYELTDAGVKELEQKIAVGEKELRKALDLMFEEPTVLDRFENVGNVATELARSIGLVGVAGRASGLAVDVRGDLGDTVGFTPAQGEDGDVLSRAQVRRQELAWSLAEIKRILAELPEGAVQAECGEIKLPANVLGVSVTEAWRGELCQVILTDENGKFQRVKIVDPSFHNWFGLAMALRNQQISDFPICNKSFNLSYCGHDL